MSECNNKYMKIIFNWNYNLLLKQELQIHNVIIVTRSVIVTTINIISKQL